MAEARQDDTKAEAETDSDWAETETRLRHKLLLLLPFGTEQLSSRAKWGQYLEPCEGMTANYQGMTAKLAPRLLRGGKIACAARKLRSLETSTKSTKAKKSSSL